MIQFDLIDWLDAQPCPSEMNNSSTINRGTHVKC